MRQLIVLKYGGECWRVSCEQDRKDPFLQRVIKINGKCELIHVELDPYKVFHSFTTVLHKQLPKKEPCLGKAENPSRSTAVFRSQPASQVSLEKTQ